LKRIKNIVIVENKELPEFLEKIRLISYTRQLGMKLKVYVSPSFMNEIKQAIEDEFIVKKSESEINSLLGFPLFVSDYIPDPPGYLFLPELTRIPERFDIEDDNWIFRADPDKYPKIFTSSD
jgi:hypothetical protein